MESSITDPRVLNPLNSIIKTRKSNVDETPLSNEEIKSILSITEKIPISDIVNNITKTPIIACLILECYAIAITSESGTYKSDSQTKLVDFGVDKIVNVVLLALSIPKYEFQWFEEADLETSVMNFQKTLRVSNYYKIRLLERLLTLKHEIDDESKLNILKGVSQYYDCDNNCPWSNTEISSVVSKILVESLKIDEELAVQLLFSFEDSLKLLSKINNESSLNPKLTTRGFNNRLSKGIYTSGNTHRDAFRGISPLLGSTFSTQLNNSDNFKLQNIGKLQSLRFVVTHLSVVKVETYWYMIFPLLLNFLDDSDLMIKINACETLTTILSKILDKPTTDSKERETKNIIVKSEVFKILSDSIVPCLLGIPNSTPARKSILLLPTAYNTMLLLLDVVYKNQVEDYNTKLSSLLTDFVFSSLAKVSDYPDLAVFLINLTKNEIFPRCGAYSVVISRRTCYAMLDTLLNPFSAYSVDMMYQSIELISVTLKAMRNLDSVKYDVLKCLLVLKKRLDKYYDGDSHQHQQRQICGIYDKIDFTITDTLDLSKDELMRVKLASV